jgi:hypothetical protein
MRDPPSNEDALGAAFNQSRLMGAKGNDETLSISSQSTNAGFEKNEGTPSLPCLCLVLRVVCRSDRLPISATGPAEAEDQASVQKIAVSQPSTLFSEARDLICACLPAVSCYSNSFLPWSV